MEDICFCGNNKKNPDKIKIILFQEASKEHECKESVTAILQDGSHAARLPEVPSHNE